MLGLLWLVPMLPLAGFAVLALGGRRLSRRIVSGVAVGSVGVSAVIALLVSVVFLWTNPSGGTYAQTLWQWMQVDGFAPPWRFIWMLCP